MRYGESSIVRQEVIEAMGDDWKRALAGMSFSSLSRHSEWDGQAVHFRFVPVIIDGEKMGIEVVSHFEIDKEKQDASTRGTDNNQSNDVQLGSEGGEG